MQGPFRSLGGCHLAVASMDGERSSVERLGFFSAHFPAAAVSAKSQLRNLRGQPVCGRPLRPFRPVNFPKIVNLILFYHPVGGPFTAHPGQRNKTSVILLRSISQWGADLLAVWLQMPAGCGSLLLASPLCGVSCFTMILAGFNFLFWFFADFFKMALQH